MYLYTFFFLPSSCLHISFFPLAKQNILQRWLLGSFSIGDIATAGKPGNCVDFVQLQKKTAFLLGLNVLTSCSVLYVITNSSEQNCKFMCR